MTKSMTGYGKAETTTGDGKLTVEIRSVNHRYGEVSVKLPRLFLPLEAELRRRVADRLKRGKIDLFVQFETVNGTAQAPQVNMALAKAYNDAFVSIRQALGIGEPVSLGLIAAQRDVLVSQETSPDLDRIAGDLYAVLDSSLESMEAMRLREGEALAAEIAGRLATVTDLVQQVATRAPVAVAGNTERLKERISRLLGETPLDETRLAQETAIMADRMDITEELVRLQSHFRQFSSTLALAEPVGRKLDFLLQEMNREVNTIGSKANDGEITTLVVDLKAELEKIREQVQNIE